MKVFTLNLANYTDHPDWERRRELIGNWIILEQPDVVLFQEARYDPNQPSTIKTGLGMVEQIISIISENISYNYFITPAQYYDPNTGAPVTGPTNFWEGLATLVLSSLTYGDYQSYILPLGGTSDLNNRIVTKLKVNNYYFINVHFSYNLSQALIQANSAIDWINSSGTKYLDQIWGGDYNMEPFQIGTTFTQYKYKDAWANLRSKAGYTYSSSKLVKRIDIFYVSQNISLISINRELRKPILIPGGNKVFASDHLGLYLEIN